MYIIKGIKKKKMSVSYAIFWLEQGIYWCLNRSIKFWKIIFEQYERV